MRNSVLVAVFATGSFVIACAALAAPANATPRADAPPAGSQGSTVPNLGGECVYQCETDAECKSGQRCIDTGCGRVCETPCDECSADRDCGPLHECATYRCGKQCAIACPDVATSTASFNELLTALTPKLNELWPTFAKQEGLDPMESVYSGDIDLGCKNGGDELCALMTGSCKKFYAHVKVTDLTGLSKLQFSSLAVTGLSTFEGSHSCPYGDQPYSGDFLCSYQGDGTGKASLPSDNSLAVDVPVIEIKTRCTFVTGTETVVQWSGNATCNAKRPSGTAEFGWCGGSCTSLDPPEVFAAAEITKLKLAVDQLTCDVKGDWMGDANSLAWITEILVPELKDEIAKALEGPLEGALDDLIEGVAPFPGECK